MHIDKNDLTIYPIGVKNVPKWRTKDGQSSKSFIPNKEVNYELIEDPITISYQNHETKNFKTH